MTGTGLGDAACELLALDKVGDTAPPDVQNGPQEHLGASAGINLGELVRGQEAALPCDKLRRTGILGRDDVICGLTCDDGCCNGGHKNMITSVIRGLMGQV